ncbi:MAG: RNA polymerase sigma factor [Chloroflexi bacterium]|nr:RNA polymerase sigma factor [Chloroflexota bacterium]
MKQDLIERALRGDELAAQELHRTYHPAVFRLAYLLLRDSADADDSTQEAFIYAFTHLERYDPRRAAFGTWLKIIVTSRCRDLQRRKRVKWLSLQELMRRGQEPEDTTPEHQPSSVLESMGLQQTVWNALNQMPDKSRQALILRYYGDMSYPEMAEALRCTVNTAKSRVVYGHQALARLLEQQGISRISQDDGQVGDTP